MALYNARMLDASNNGEGVYPFDGPDDLMAQTADEIVGVFFNHVDNQILTKNADWEVNGIMKNKERGVVTAIGSLIPERGDPPLPFLLMIAAGNQDRS